MAADRARSATRAGNAVALRPIERARIVAREGVTLTMQDQPGDVELGRADDEADREVLVLLLESDLPGSQRQVDSSPIVMSTAHPPLADTIAVE
jgi:hypothetical protein